MKMISWNVNGLRAVVKKGFMDFFKTADADVFCLQEIKLQEGQIVMDLPGYHLYWNYAEKKGYSGTAVFTRQEPLTVHYGINHVNHANEGRALTLEFDDFYLVNVYTPNSQHGLLRLDYRLEWEEAVLDYVSELDSLKPVVLCGDLNVAHQEIDLKNPKANRKNSGFTPEERGKMTEFLKRGFTDSFRYFHPDLSGAYTWWSYRTDCRPRNIGWRIDYFLVSDRMAPIMKNAKIHSEIEGSDHCPIELVIQ
ncbi:exodeoxyribonuclease III [Metaplanococcus flavidus]|uniref:Exodeoxyribonuclease III n=1 Tax=Metaplanococcus flavidus TaxID=569883 RepID=A0ABW3LDH1_9BACL